MTPPNKLRMAFLKCDRIHKDSQAEHGSYEAVMHTLFEPLLAGSGRGHELELETISFDVVRAREYPTDAQLDSIDAIIVSGSFEDDAHEDATWILRLAGFLIGVADSFPRIRIIGVCFGLQVIARAFGPSQIVPNEAGWEVGSTELQLTEEGRKIIWGEKGADQDSLPQTVVMQQIHADIVRDVPGGFVLLATSEKTPVQAICKFYDGKPPAFTHTEDHALPDAPWSKIHIIAFQGHPEWHEEIIIPFINDYEADGTFEPGFAEEGRRRTQRPHDGERVGKMLLRILGIA